MFWREIPGISACVWGGASVQFGRRMFAVVALHHEKRGFLYGLESDQDETTILDSSHGEFTSVCVSPIGNHVTGGTIGGGVVVWSLISENRNVAESVDTGHDADTIRTNRTADGRSLDDRSLIAEHVHCSIHRGSVTAIAVSDDGTIVSGGDDGSLASWKINQVNNVCDSLSIDEQSYNADQSHDGKFAIVGCLDGAVWRVKLATGTRDQIREATGVRTTALTFSNDGRFVVVIVDPIRRFRFQASYLGSLSRALTSSGKNLTGTEPWSKTAS